jgi:hypothetical protein
MTIQKKKFVQRNDPYYYNPHVTVFYEFKHGNDEITIGTPLKFKYERSVFKFMKAAHHSEKNVTWIDCMETVTGVFRSFYVEELKGVVKPKKRRKKRVNGNRTGTG